MPPYISIGGYSDPPRIAHLSVEVCKGELVVVTGGPGSGKSNLIKSVAGIRPFNKGTIKLMGSRAGTLRSRKNTVFVFQSGNFSPELPVNIQLQRRTALLLGKSPREMRRKVTKWSADMELENKMSCLPGELNRSELQLFSLAPLAIVKPMVAVLDEPVVELSPIMASSAMSFLIPMLEESAVLAACRGRSPLAGKADRVVSLV